MVQRDQCDGGPGAVLGPCADTGPGGCIGTFLPRCRVRCPWSATGSSGIYFRPESAGQQILVGSLLEEDEQEVVDPDSYSAIADRSFVDLKIHLLHHRIPSLPHRGSVSGMAALYTINRQDVHPIIGPTAIEGFAVANGFSGHGFKESQMVGSMMAQWLTGERADWDTDVPMSFFSVDREPIDVDEKTVLGVGG